MNVKFKRKNLYIAFSLFCIGFLIIFKCLSPTVQKEHDSHGELSKDVPETISKDQSVPLTLVIAIMSAPTKSVTRNVLRKTWLSSSNPQVRHIFIVGTKQLSSEVLVEINDENAQFNDILLLRDIKDSYTSLTEKLLASFKWIHNHLKFQFLLKCDDDSFVRIPLMLEELQKQPQERLYWGFFKGGSTVYRTGKWQEPDWFLCDTYLPYALGGGYILSTDLVKYVADSEPYLQRYRGEDVSLGLWLSPLKLNRIHDVRFDTEYKSRGCFNDYLITHKQTVGDMREKHSNLENIGKLCQTERRVKYSYNYNWTVPPSQCCKQFDHSLP